MAATESNEPPTALTAGPTAEKEENENLVPGCGRGWPAFWIFILCFVACTTFLGQMIPGMSLRYFNGWRGDPCAMIGSLSVDCQIATMKSLEVQSTFSMAKNMLVIIASPFIGILADSVGRLRLIWGGVFIAALTVLALTFLYFQLVAIRTFYFAQTLTGLIPIDLLTNLWITDRTSAKQRVILYGVISAVFSGEGVVVPFVSVFLSRWGCMEASLICFGITLFFIAFFVPESLPPEKRQPFRMGSAGRTIRDSMSIFAGRGYRIVVIFSIIIVGTQTCVSANIQLLLRERYGFNRQQTMPLVTAVGLTTLLSQLFIVGPLVHWLGLKGMLHLGMGLLALAHFVMGVSGHYWLSFLSCIMAGVGFIATPALLATVMNLAPAKQRGAVQGAYMALMNAGIAVFTFVYTRFHAYFARPRLWFEKPFPGFPLIVVALMELGAVIALPFLWHHVERAEEEARSEEAREAVLKKDLVNNSKLIA